MSISSSEERSLVTFFEGFVLLVGAESSASLVGEFSGNMIEGSRIGAVDYLNRPFSKGLISLVVSNEA